MQKQASIVLGVLLGLFLMSSVSWAGSSCSATNDNGDAQCSITCSEGQAAQCSNATGSGTPTCECVDQSGGLILNEFSIAMAAQLERGSDPTLGENLDFLRFAQTACLRMIPVSKPGKYAIYNKCGMCRKAVMTWCNGNIRKTNVPANKKIEKSGCIGTITLIAEENC